MKKQQQQVNEALDLGAWLGRKQAFSLLAGRCSAADAECLRKMRDQKGYKSLGLSWEAFCRKHLGISRTAAEKTISLLNEFGPQYFELTAVVRLTPEEYRRIAPAVTPAGVEHQGRVLEITMGNAPALSEAVHELKQDTGTVVAEVADDAAFDRTLDRACRSLRIAVQGFDQAAAMNPVSDSRLRLVEELGRASQELFRVMKDTVPAARLLRT
jgi:hypothetical protein